MAGLVSYLRDLLRWTDNNIKRSNKRARLEDDSEDDPTFNITTHRLPKRQKIATLTIDDDSEATFIRYIPIRVQQRQSTSTPQSTNKPQYTILQSSQGKLSSRIEALMNNEKLSIIDEEKAKYVIDISSDDEEDNSDVVFVKKYEAKGGVVPSYSKFDHSLRRRSALCRPQILNGSGVTKSYKRDPPPSFPDWLNEVLNRKVQKPANSTGGPFNLEEKRLYQELISNQNESPLVCAVKAAKIGVPKEPEEQKDSDTVSTTSRIVDPVNSLKESFKDISITKKDWLIDLNERYDNKAKDLFDPILETIKETNKVLEKIRKENSVLLMQYDLKVGLELPSSLIDTKQELDIKLPELTEEHNKAINNALSPGPPNEVLIEKFSLIIHRSDIKTLYGLNWLNDVIINFYMSLIMQRSQQNPRLPKTYTTNTFFFERLKSSGQTGLRRWTRKVDIFSHDLMTIPVHLGVHWCMCLVDLRRKRVQYLDSMNGPHHRCPELVMQYLRDEHLDKKGTPMDDDQWVTEQLQDIPQQMNGSDCGMFSVTFAEFASRGAPFTFSQGDMPYLRRKAVWEITQGRLLM